MNPYFMAAIINSKNNKYDESEDDDNYEPSNCFKYTIIGAVLFFCLMMFI